MDKQVDKNLEKVADKIMQALSIESPSIDFTNTIMGKVEALESKKTTTYTPLIPKYLWYLVGFVLVAITLYLVVNNTGSETSLFSSLDFSKITNNTITQSVSEFKMPKTLIYAFLSLGIMVCVQVPFLKHYFDKRLSE